MNLRLSVATEIPSGAGAVACLLDDQLQGLGSCPAPARPSLDSRRFTGKIGQATVLDGDGGQLVVAVGTGPASSEAPSDGILRTAAAAACRSAGGSSSLAVDLRGTGLEPRRAAQVVAEGAVGATYRFGRFRSSEPDLPALGEVVVVVDPDGEEAARAGLEAGIAVGKAVTLARDLSNTPPGDMTPSLLADVALDVAERSGLEASVLDEDAIVEAGLGGLLGVARGSSEPPRLIKLVYTPEGGAGGEVPTVALVGKGITFDSGGLSLKPADGMMTMKTDMSGAADVIAVLGACGALGVKVRVVGFAPTTENMPGGRAIKPGDVLVTRNRKTIEVLNTDAEGRLVLADALALAAEEAPDAIIDLATLTGACVVALGRKIAGLMGNDSRLLAAVERAGEAAGEPVWRLPLPDAYRPDIDSQVADMKNMGRPREAGALVAGLLLEEFVADRPWAHLDIAGPSHSDEEAHEIRKGSTGFGVRLLLELLRSYEPIGGPADDRADRLGA